MGANHVIVSGSVQERPRVFRVARAGVLIVAMFSTLGALTQGITVAMGSLFAFGGADGRLPLTSLPQIKQAELRAGATGTLVDADPLLRLLGGLPSLLQAATIVLATVFLLRVLRGVAVARPFDPFVVSSWRGLSLALLIGGVAQGLAATAATIYLVARLGSFDGSSAAAAQRAAVLGGEYDVVTWSVPQWPIVMLVAGLVSFALAAAFRAGGKLEREVEGVV
ncbi:hypothetical protein [Rathayibacter sp. AY1F9]|jgi:hypothetical protein|uniref:hypothetical protein n=1 Tax=Rathayibacter sp. AY1F9 TaxID=2080563 RepID=UPI000CE8F9A3|nr:hypothetical protein [Rathayibacter sp. AY1F9]PPH25793.1 hypothetical protein C5C37_16975 [Rathayibacter sp. AY1F9]